MAYEIKLTFDNVDELPPLVANLHGLLSTAASVGVIEEVLADAFGIETPDAVQPIRERGDGTSVNQDNQPAAKRRKKEAEPLKAMLQPAADVSETDIKARMKEMLQRENGVAELKAVFGKFGTDRLSGLQSNQYAAFMQESAVSE